MSVCCFQEPMAFANGYGGTMVLGRVKTPGVTSNPALPRMEQYQAIECRSDEVLRLKEENSSLKTAVAETILENQRLKISLGL